MVVVVDRWLLDEVLLYMPRKSPCFVVHDLLVSYLAFVLSVSCWQCAGCRIIVTGLLLIWPVSWLQRRNHWTKKLEEQKQPENIQAMISCKALNMSLVGFSVL